MKQSSVVLLLTLALYACTSDAPAEKTLPAAPPPPPMMTGVRDSLILLKNAPPFVIPHYNDSAWTILYMVRHAEKAQDSTKNPPLSPEGVLRATRLGDMLASTRLDRIGCSNLKRNMQTAEAVKSRCNINGLDVFAADLVYEWMQDLLINDPGAHVLYVGHSNTLPEVLNRLTANGLYTDIPDTDYTRFYVVATRGLGESEVWAFSF